MTGRTPIATDRGADHRRHECGTTTAPAARAARAASVHRRVALETARRRSRCDDTSPSHTKTHSCRPRPRRWRTVGSNLRNRRTRRAVRSARGHRLQRCRRLRRRECRRLHRRGTGQRHHAASDVARLHRRREEHRPLRAVDPAAAGIPRIRKAPGLGAAAGAQRCLALPARRQYDHERLRAARSCDTDRRIQRRRGRSLPVRRLQPAGPDQRLPRAESQAVPGRDRPRHGVLSRLRHR